MSNYTSTPPANIDSVGRRVARTRRRYSAHIDALVVGVLMLATVLVGFAGIERLVV